MGSFGKIVVGDDYAKPLFTRLYKNDRKKLDELIKSYPLIPKADPRKGRPTDREITDSEVVRLAIHKLHYTRVIRKKARDRKKKL